MKRMSESLNQRLKDAVNQIRKPGCLIQVYWRCDAQGGVDEPWNQQGEWGGDLECVSELRRWIRKNGADGRTVTIYCMGDYIDVTLV